MGARLSIENLGAVPPPARPACPRVPLTRRSGAWQRDAPRHVPVVMAGVTVAVILWALACISWMALAG
jgi:hypothetical protein